MPAGSPASHSDDLAEQGFQARRGGRGGIMMAGDGMATDKARHGPPGRGPWQLGRPPKRIPPPDELDLTGISYWMICLAAFFEWEASAWKDNSWPWHPSFTNLIDPLLAPHMIKSVAILVWLLAGWALVRR